MTVVSDEKSDQSILKKIAFNNAISEINSLYISTSESYSLLDCFFCEKFSKLPEEDKLRIGNIHCSSNLRTYSQEDCTIVDILVEIVNAKNENNIKVVWISNINDIQINSGVYKKSSEDKDYITHQLSGLAKKLDLVILVGVENRDVMSSSLNQLGRQIIEVKKIDSCKENVNQIVLNVTKNRMGRLSEIIVADE